jgi:glycine cleavage system transcriptional repressor
MENKYILSAFCKDRPGIVAAITQVLYELGCNLEDSTMTRMLNEFAIILLFTSRESGLKDQLEQACEKLEKEKGITAIIRSVETEDEQKPDGHVDRVIRVTGVDQTGIVYKVSRFLANNNINIENLTSHRTISPESGTVIYSMELAVQIPNELSLEELENGISQVGEELNLDITVM